ncbi:MAG: hypothetical protein CVV64_02140 [Candidatus Wallbacteria bacterium HGW-Wallbacteria-1]|jgi:hypothetical protein|uniref:DUF4912 domain-containing protein n=1 Tax=Candidatus Wallbacteria bacterium HGW-Wallbacteria-1 TaxID=2013854 RepID=A0A2N1PV68_9BACT|nr:MAG: hypothetical protein CVV64_02140 [Candidatus Wallbacteria bacterium HGW-Wallbacteria-1]
MAAGEPMDKLMVDEDQTGRRFDFDLDREPVLPAEYGRTTLVFMVRDPWWGYAYWEITEETRSLVDGQLTSQELEDSRMVLRVLDRTEGQPLEQCSSFDIAIPEEFRVASWYVNFPHPARFYSLAIGRLTHDGALHVMALSNTIEVPAANYSENVDHSWEIRDDDFQRILSAEMARIREIRSQQFRNARDLNVERDRQFQTRVLRVPTGESLSSADLVKPGMGMTSVDDIGGSSEMISEFALSSEAQGGSSELIHGLNLAPGSSEELRPVQPGISVVPSGSSEQLIAPGSSENIFPVPGLEIPFPGEFPGSSEQVPAIGSSEQPLVLRPVVAVALPAEVLLRPGSSGNLLTTAINVSSETPGSSENLVKPGASEQLVAPAAGPALVLPGSSEMSVAMKPKMAVEALRPGSSENIMVYPAMQVEAKMVGASEQLAKPGVPLMMPGSSEGFAMPVFPVGFEQPGSSENLLMPGASENLLMPGASEGLIIPGSSELSFFPGSSEGMLSPGSSGEVSNSGEVFFDEGNGFAPDLNVELTLYGGTDPGSSLTIAGETVETGQDGRFSVRLALPVDGEVEIPVIFERDGILERRILTVRTGPAKDGR